jgi:hypothetical protein
MSDYCKIGSTVLTPYVQKKRNLPGEVKAKIDVVNWGDRARVYREGRNARGMELDLLAVNSEANLEAAIKAINDAAEDTAFYPHTTARFARVALASAWPEEIIQKINAFWRGKAKIYYNSPYLFGAATTWTPSLNALSAAITPAGSVAAPLDAASITGAYSGGAHHAGLSIEIYDSGGTTLRDSLLISNRLLSDEVLTLDYKGKIIQTYADDFAASTRWTQDALNDGCTHGSGKITVGNEKSLYYWLKGPWPLAKNIVVSADIAITAGTPVLQYSFDGITWTTAYSGTQLTASRTWVIPNTSGRGDVYIRFKSQSSDYASLTTALTGNNNDLTFTAQKSGTDGNSVSVKYTNAGGTQTLLITITGNDIDIRLRTTSGTINSTSAEIQSAFYGDPGVMALIRSAAHASGNDGSGVVTALAKTNLAGATMMASMTVDNLSIAQERYVPESELPVLPLGSDSKVKIAGTAGNATISCDYRDRFWI